MRKHYLLCYDVKSPKRLYRVRKLAYPLALGGQKSALQTLLGPEEVSKLLQAITKKMDTKHDRLHLVEIYPEPIDLGCAVEAVYDKGAIII